MKLTYERKLEICRLKEEGLSYRDIAKLFNLPRRKIKYIWHLYENHGEDIKAVSEILGHGKIDITLDIYHHAIDETKIKLINNTADSARQIKRAVTLSLNTSDY